MHQRPLRPWLRGVLRNRLAFRRRSEGRRRAREQAVSVSEAVPATDELLERAELHGGLVQALIGMREPYRGVLLMRYYGELVPSEIARRRGVPAATVCRQLHSGLEELRAEFDRNYGGDRWRALLALLKLAEPPRVQREG